MYIEVEHICVKCCKRGDCHLWEQVQNIDESFVRDAFEYDPATQSVCTTVSYCHDYVPGPLVEGG